MAASQATDKVSMAGIGEKLKCAREKRGFTIDQARKETHIHSTVLTALEEGRCDEILTPTYVKSFLKKYSGYLGLDTKVILDEYKQVHPEPSFLNISRRVEEDRPANLLKYAYLIKPLAILAVVTFFIFLLGNIAANYFRAPKAAAGVSASGRGQAALQGKIAARGSSQYAKKGPENVSAMGKVVAFQEPIPKKAPLSLIVKVKQQVLVQLKKDGVLLYKRVLAKGSTETLTAENTINVFVSKAEAIELTLNGKRLKIEQKGQIKDLEISRRGFRIK